MYSSIPIFTIPHDFYLFKYKDCVNNLDQRSANFSCSVKAILPSVFAWPAK